MHLFIYFKKNKGWFELQEVKSLEVCHTCSHIKKKVEQTENQQLFLDPTENWGHRANSLPENWRER